MNTIKSIEKAYIHGCAWGEHHPVKIQTVSFEVADGHNYTNGRRSECFNTEEEATNEALKKFIPNGVMTEESCKYWNDQVVVVSKVTITTEIIRIVQPTEKK